MGKNLKGCVFVLLTAVFLSACGNTQKNENVTTIQPETADTMTNAETSETTENMLDSFSEQPLNLKKYALSYDWTKEDQPYFFWNYATKSEYGYYYFDSSNLMFFDKKSKKSVPLCNQADCKHNDSKCNAYINDLENYSISRSCVQYYEGNLYLTGFDYDGYACLFRISEDGSTREKYMQLYKADFSSADGMIEWHNPEICIHRGYVYFIDGKESVPKLRRMKLGTTETEVVFETTGLRPNLYRMLGYGDYLFFQTGNFVDDSYIDIKAGLFAYNVQTGEIQLVKKDVLSTYIVENNILYYNYNGNTEFWSFDLQTLEEKKILEDLQEGAALSADRQYIYKFVNGVLFVYDHNGTGICTVNGEAESCYFGDGTYLLGSAYDRNEMKSFGCFIEVADFADGKAEWTYLD